MKNINYHKQQIKEMLEAIPLPNEIPQEVIEVLSSIMLKERMIGYRAGFVDVTEFMKESVLEK